MYGFGFFELMPALKCVKADGSKGRCNVKDVCSKEMTYEIDYSN